MKYDPECGAYVADITDAAATCKSRDLQLKFIVDGEWKLETTLPVCQASISGSLRCCIDVQAQILPFLASLVSPGMSVSGAIYLTAGVLGW